MNRLLTTFLFVLGSSMLFAQQMSDEQVVEYVVNAQSEGQSQDQIVSELLKRGVTMAQYNRIRKKVDETKKRNIAGGEDNEDFRMRTAVNNEYSRELEEGQSRGKEIFGHRMFQNKEIAFEASYNLPTPSNYKLGAGDQIVIDVWGASQSSVQKTISPDGIINVDNLGPIHLSGLTIEQANKVLKEEFGSIFSGINGETPISNMRLSLAQNRSIQVHVMGEVVNPGTYMMSSFATIFNALYQAGGVNEVGTLRAVKVYRKDKLVATYDVYDFILNGNSNAGIRLEDNDVVTVDVCKNLVAVTGSVKRPMYYEMLDTETVSQLLKYAGGLNGNAYKENVRLIRNGIREREIYILNVDEQQEFMIADGDSVSIDSIMSTFANMVEVKGAVYRPGQYQMDDCMNTVKQLIECAGGLKDEAFLNRAILNRRKANNTMENLSVNLDQLMNGAGDDIILRKNDVLYIPNIFDLQENQTVHILGEVLFPGTYEFADNMSVEDLIVLAGGLTEAASTVKIEVARRIKNSRATQDNDTLSYSYLFSVGEDLIVNGDSNFTLQPFDQVFVRKSPRSIGQENMLVEGEVVFPGNYNLVSKKMRLSQIVEMAGGLTSSACVEDAQMERLMSAKELEMYKESLENQLRIAKNTSDSLRISQLLAEEVKSYKLVIDLKKALEEPGSEYDIVLENGDRLYLPRYSPVVKIYGAVQQENIVMFESNKKLRYYINQAGGFSEMANKRNIYIMYSDGSLSKARKIGQSNVKPGCSIYVPTKEERSRMSTGELLGLGSTVASLATVVMALVNMIK